MGWKEDNVNNMSKLRYYLADGKQWTTKWVPLNLTQDIQLNNNLKWSTSYIQNEHSSILRTIVKNYTKEIKVNLVLNILIRDTNKNTTQYIINPRTLEIKLHKRKREYWDKEKLPYKMNMLMPLLP